LRFPRKYQTRIPSNTINHQRNKTPSKTIKPSTIKLSNRQPSKPLTTNHQKLKDHQRHIKDLQKPSKTIKDHQIWVGASRTKPLLPADTKRSVFGLHERLGSRAQN
jgi:hypothetical protein